jgi:endo-1,4-beta-xylanase
MKFFEQKNNSEDHSMENKQFHSSQAATTAVAFTFALSMTALLQACGGAGPSGPAAEGSPGTPAKEPEKPGGGARSIKQAYEAYFPIGAAVGPEHLAKVGAIIETHFNHLTAENAMKFGPIHPAPDTWSYVDADAVADYARKLGMKMTGHTFVWHRMQPDWLFADLKPGDPASIDKLKERLRTHINTMVKRYGDVVDNWDVVNEAISDTPEKLYRDGSEDSKWYEIYGNESYIVDAFSYAKEALEKATGSAEGKMYYNEYGEGPKFDKCIKLAKWLRDEKGIPVAGIGIQAHWNLEWPPVDEVQRMIDEARSAGFKVKISELDLSIYSKDDWANKVWEPGKLFDEQVKEAQANRFGSLFATFRKNKDAITSVTTWGVADDSTWLDAFPVAGRNNYPLLFDDAHQPKSSVAKIVDF